MQYDFSKYVGIPFESHGRNIDGMDCLGLVIHVYAMELRLALPDCEAGYDDAYARGQVQKCVDGHDIVDWCFNATDLPREIFDVLVFRVGGLETHVALYISNGAMLHLMHGSHSIIERIDSSKWKNRLTKVYRHVTRK